MDQDMKSKTFSQEKLSLSYWSNLIDYHLPCVMSGCRNQASESGVRGKSPVIIADAAQR